MATPSLRSNDKLKCRNKLPCTQQLRLKAGYQKLKKTTKKAVRKSMETVAELEQKSRECMSCVLVNYHARGWARDQSVFIDFPQPLHLNSRTKCSRRGRTNSPATLMTQSGSESRSNVNCSERVAQPLEAVNVVCRAWLQNTKQLTVDHMKTMFYGKCDQVECRQMTCMQAAVATRGVKDHDVWAGLCV